MLACLCMCIARWQLGHSQIREGREGGEGGNRFGEHVVGNVSEREIRGASRQEGQHVQKLCSRTKPREGPVRYCSYNAKWDECAEVGAILESRGAPYELHFGAARGLLLRSLKHFSQAAVKRQHSSDWLEDSLPQCPCCALLVASRT